MAGRNHIPANGSILGALDDPRLLHQHPRTLHPPELHLIEDRIAGQSREIKTLLLDNQRLASSHVALKQDVVDAEHDVRRLSAVATSIKAERDAQVRDVYERSLKLEAEARSMDGLSTELGRVRADIKELQTERKELVEKLKDIDDDVAKCHLELHQLPHIKAEIEALRRDIQRGRAALDYERKMRSRNFEQNEVMERHMISLAREADKLRSELANAEKKAMVAAYPGAGYATQNTSLEPGYGENSVSNNLYAVHQV
ncbi:hypothetical protein BUALT_Bualt02G0071600 [Buddleja alternifolia]|uniref:Protein FLC EXPRESSOR n=1 Tax=Buddleja alternifolia TaxID=168488 RepID=A0AAV6XY53_9LAMI|nr:hypothetical protein BUALT_Bualt02G0071600 [Buddleja alternifolia]